MIVGPSIFLLGQHYQAQGTHTTRSLSEVYFLSDHHPPRKEVGGKESRGHRVLASESPPTLLYLVTLLIKLGLMCDLLRGVGQKDIMNDNQLEFSIHRQMCFTMS